jgi:hypothetical protein
MSSELREVALKGSVTYTSSFPKSTFGGTSVLAFETEKETG